MMSVITLGEILMRLSTTQHQRFQACSSLACYYGGAEMNVAIGLSGFGVPTAMITGLPKNALGDIIIQTLHRYNVNTKNVFQKEGRLGLYFVEEGFGQRAPNIIYDREHSVFNQMTLEEIHIEQMLHDYDWFHFTGITPALNDTLFKLMKKITRIAKQQGMTISCDLNYRAQLWDFQTARDKMSELLPDVDIIFGYEPLNLINIATGEDKKYTLSRNPSLDDLRPILKEIHELYDLRYIAFTQRKIFNHKRNRLQSFISTTHEMVKSPCVDVEILERVGTGDAFSVGVLYGLIQQWSLQETVNFGLKNMCYKHTIHGDYCYATLDEVQSMQFNGSDINR